MRYRPEVVGLVWRTAWRYSGTLKRTPLLAREKKKDDHIRLLFGEVMRRGMGSIGLGDRREIEGRMQAPASASIKETMTSG